MGTETVGTGETYTTITAWEATEVSGTLSAPAIAECKAENFSEAVYLNGATTSATNYIHLTVQSGAEHDGRADAVSSVGNARMSTPAGNTSTIRIADDHVEVSWLEIIDAGGGTGTKGQGVEGINGGAAASNFRKIHHLVMHNDGKSTGTGNAGIYLKDADQIFEIYRNVIYGTGGSGIRHTNATGTAAEAEIYGNVIHKCNQAGHASLGGIQMSKPGLIKNNLLLANGTNDIADTSSGSTFTTNATSDATGSSGLINLTANDEVINPFFIGYTAIDLLIESAATSVDAGTDLGSPYDTDITNVAATGTWDVGADELAASGSSVVVLRRRIEGY